jgi:hypothetical protein
MLAIMGFPSEADHNRCRVKRRRVGDVVDLDASESDENGSPSPRSIRQGRTPSGRMVRKNNVPNKTFGSKYRHPDNRKELMGELMPLGKAFAIIAVMTHGPDPLTELALHNERHRIFMQAAQYAMSEHDIQTVLEHPVSGLIQVGVNVALFFCGEGGRGKIGMDSHLKTLGPKNNSTP